MNRRNVLKTLASAAIVPVMPTTIESYKEDSNFQSDCGATLDYPIWWNSGNSSKFKYEWCELWCHVGMHKVGIIDVKKENALYWRTPHKRIYGKIVIETGISKGVEWIRVLRKTNESVIV